MGLGLRKLCAEHAIAAMLAEPGLTARSTGRIGGCEKCPASRKVPMLYVAEDPPQGRPLHLTDEDPPPEFLSGDSPPQ